MHFLFDYSDEVTFHGQISAHEARAALTSSLHRPIGHPDENLSTLFPSRLNGRVDGAHVVLHRSRSLAGNYFSKPIFTGTLREENGKAVLRGIFSVSILTKFNYIAATLLFAAVECIIIYKVLRFPNGITEIALATLFIPIGYAIAIAIFLVSKRVFRGDVVWIQREIVSALSGSNHQNGATYQPSF